MNLLFAFITSQVGNRLLLWSYFRELLSMRVWRIHHGPNTLSFVSISQAMIIPEWEFTRYLIVGIITRDFIIFHSSLMTLIDPTRSLNKLLVIIIVSIVFILTMTFSYFVIYRVGNLSCRLICVFRTDCLVYHRGICFFHLIFIWSITKNRLDIFRTSYWLQ